MMKKAHAKYSASGAPRWVACPGSIKLSEGIPPEPDSPYALEGTKAHSALERLLKNPDEHLESLDFIRRQYSQQMAVHVDMAFREIMKRKSALKGSELKAETRVKLPFSEPGQFGTADAIILEHFGKLVVIDFKYGAGIPVSVEGNEQLICYGLGVAHQYDYNFTSIDLLIIQPRAAIGGEYVRSWTTSMEVLKRWLLRFDEAIALSKKKNPPLLSGEHCRFCPAKKVCPEVGNQTLRKAQSAFSKIT